MKRSKSQIKSTSRTKSAPADSPSTSSGQARASSPASVFHVLPKQENQTIAAALRQWLPGQSWGQIRKLMKGRQVMVSGNLCVDAGRRLKLQDVIKILPQPSAPPPKADDVGIRYLDEHVVVVEKPPGLTSNRHKDELQWPAKRRQLQPTLDELLPNVIARVDPRLRRHKGVPLPVRPVHRLDRETSGLMVFARTVRAERSLGEQFRRHTTERRYIAIVQGSIEAQTISSRLVRDRGDGRRGSTNVPNVGKPATTHIRPIDQLPGYTMIECQVGNWPDASNPHSSRRAGPSGLRRQAVSSTALPKANSRHEQCPTPRAARRRDRLRPSAERPGDAPHDAAAERI